AMDGELAGLARRYPVVVAECDCKVHRTYRYRGRITKVRGGGGTSFLPPLEPDFLRRHKADVVLYLTDGHGPAPECPPRVPVVWVIIPGGRVPAAWGRVVHIPG